MTVKVVGELLPRFLVGGEALEEARRDAQSKVGFLAGDLAEVESTK